MRRAKGTGEPTTHLRIFFWRLFKLSVTGRQQLRHVLKSKGAASDSGVTGRALVVCHLEEPLPSTLQLRAVAAACLDVKVTTAYLRERGGG